MLDDGRLQRYVTELQVTGLTSNPTIFDEAIGSGDAYDADIARKTGEGKSGEALFTELALDDLRRAADLFRPAFDRTQGVDGWVSMELSPLLAADTAGSVSAATRIHAAANIPNLFVKIPGTPAGCAGHRAVHFRGHARQRHAAVLARAVPGRRQRLSTRHRAAYRGGALAAGGVRGVAVREPLGQGRRRPGARRAAQSAGHRHRAAHLLWPTSICTASARWKQLAAAGARPQRMLWASTGTKDPKVARIAVRRSIRRARHHRHAAREDACWRCRASTPCRRPCPPIGGTRSTPWRSSQRPASMSTRWRCACRRRARRLS